MMIAAARLRITSDRNKREVRPAADNGGRVM
jgi:hypothetical protein